MTILFVTHYAGFYGANKSLYTLMLLLRERHGVEPMVLLPHEGVMCSQLHQAGIPYVVHHYYWWMNDNHGLFQWALNKRKQWRNIFKVAHIVRHLSSRPDIVYSNSTTINTGFLIAQMLHIPHVWHLRESMSQFGLSLSLSLSLSKRIYRAPVNKKYILISDYMMRDYAYLLPHERMVRIYNGVSLPPDVVPRTINEMRDGVLHVALVGVVSVQKNQLELLKAIALLRQKGVWVHAHLIGGRHSETYYQQLSTFIKENDIINNVTFHGHTNDVFSILREMNLGIVTAKDEAFGRVTIEEMLMRLPVIASDSGANPELVTPGITGDLYPLGDVETLADKIKQYMLNPEWLQEQGTKAYERAVRDFSAESNAERVWETIHNKR